MPRFLYLYLRGYHRYALPVLTVLVLVVLAWYAWYWAVAGFVALGLILYVMYKKEQAFAEEFQTYITTLRHRVKKVGEDVISELPIGILLYDEEQTIQWHNRYILKLFAEADTLVGTKLEELSPSLAEWLKKEEREGTIRFNELSLDIISYPEERLLYVIDNTGYHELKKKYRQEQVVFLNIHLDNLDEVTQGLDEQRRSLLVGRVTNTISRWASEHGIYLKRTASDKFFGVMDEQTLREIEETKFDILDRVRELTRHNKIPVTLSIGVGAGNSSLTELGDLAQSSLDLALGREGDQAAVKRYPDKVTFYGGKSNAVEKRTRVRARVISHALRDMIKESDKVFIMGHRDPDMDAVGAAIGMLKAVQVNEREGYIVLDQEEEYPSISRLMEEINKEKDLKEHLLSPHEAVELISDKSLLIIVDVHKPSLVLEPRLLDSFERKVVIDHHRRGEAFIAEPLLVYIEPYASSTSELVTELLEYQSDHIEMSRLEATVMLAGIVVDTNNFSMRTGSRTFDAAAYLRRHGADPILVQKLLKEEKEQFIKRSRIVEQAEIYRGKIAIAVAEADERYGQVLLAQTADTLLTLDDVVASFVLSKREDGQVVISARSLGEINVQVIMEKMHGGGHLTNAATQLEDISVEDAVQWLKEVIDEYLEGGRET
ncbi:DHH family phosphoesterase [Caldalkalibacillus thermarum TA2.A1]|uniref:Cyclic-di-AMP phosphodiesterase n=1 Tax=Caldalkalibacillus thermarum (strain TA2.A1) TaxID=986075 RepID=A0A8X8IA33_CALTT|nr:DHH family phosphoesterase [Caldalkalibacillus thermarum]QZT34262.1 DHH family phosphoesterase [Caldalkalibacillus thermarum TA2.A1]